MGADPRTFRACRFRKVRFVHIDGVATEDRLGDNGLQPPSRLETGPHVMIVGAKGLLDVYPRSPKPDTSVPYVMWPDTPYEHLMIPVR
jgi:hypothetical protein